MSEYTQKEGDGEERLMIRSGGHVIPTSAEDIEKWTKFFRERSEEKAAREAKAKY